jgi:hypothetical protein
LPVKAGLAPLARWPSASLDAQILTAGLVELGWRRRLSVRAGKEVRPMKTYHVHVFLPTVVEIEAEDEAQALEKVVETYRELYAKNLHTWIEPEIQPEDVV